MATVEGSLIAVAVAIVTAVGTWLTAMAQKPKKDEALSREEVADRQVARLEAEIVRRTQTEDYLRHSIIDADRRAQHSRDGWWRTYRNAMQAGVEMGDDLHPPFNGELKE